MDCIEYDTSGLLKGGAIYKALGIYSAPGAEVRYIIAIPGMLRAYRASEFGGSSTLLDLYPDADHWRALFPSGHKGIDSMRARAALMRECREAGYYLPPPDIRPYKPGTRRDRGGVRHDHIPPGCEVQALEYQSKTPAD